MNKHQARSHEKTFDHLHHSWFLILHDMSILQYSVSTMGDVSSPYVRSVVFSHSDMSTPSVGVFIFCVQRADRLYGTCAEM